MTSPRIARLAWPEEVFYRRLMSVVDDFGRYYADNGLLRAACYPRQLNKVSDSDIEKWMGACSSAALVRVYPAKDGERYLQLLDFRQQTRAKTSRFPQMPCGCAAFATQGHCECDVSARLYVSVFGDEDGSSSAEPTAKCPHDEIVSLYHANLQELPRVKLMTDSRKDALRAFWKWVLTSTKTDGERRATDADSAIRWIGDYFTRAGANDFLMGRQESNGKHQGWRADLDFLLTEKGKKHVIERTEDPA